MQYSDAGNEPLHPFDIMLVKVGLPEEKVVDALVALLFTRVNEVVLPALKALANLGLFHGNRLNMLQLGILAPLMKLSNDTND